MSQAAQKEIRGEPEVPVRLAARVGVADSLAGRLKGLLGRPLHEDEGLFIAPCSSVHTMGMSYPLDIVFVDTDARAVALYPDLKPWRATRWVPGACGALELPAGTLAKAGLRIGDRVEVPGPLRSSLKKGFIANLVLGAFWLFLAANMVPALLAGDAGPSAYMLFAVNSLIAVLFLTRREEIRVTESSRDRLVTVVCVLLSFSLRPAPGASLIST